MAADVFRFREGARHVRQANVDDVQGTTSTTKEQRQQQQRGRQQQQQQPAPRNFCNPFPAAGNTPITDMSFPGIWQSGDILKTKI